MSKFILHRRLWVIPLTFWLALAALSLSWNWNEIDSHHREVVTNRARFIFKMIESVRLWNARHGGLYALVNEQTPPNPYLDVAERDISTPSGRPLTLINPAYMTRQLADVVNEVAGVKIHITSRKPINPGNQAAPWEEAALKQFEEQRELKEWSSFHIGENGEESFRYIAPLMTQRACLDCHARQGYRLGDIRGGISITFPPGPLLLPLDSQQRNLLVIHLAALLLLGTLTLLFLSRLRRQLLALESAKAQQEQLVEIRTSELQEKAQQHQLAESKLRSFIETSGEGILVVDNQGRITLCNPAALLMLGYRNEGDLLGHVLQQIICPDKGNTTAPCQSGDCAIFRSYHKGEATHQEETEFRHANGSLVPVELRSQPLNGDKQPEGAVITFADISLRLAREQQVRKLSKALEFSPVAAMITDQEGHIEYANHRFLEESGYRIEELLGNNPAIFKSGHTPEATYKAMWHQLKRGESWHGELLNRKKSGELYWDDTAIAPITDEHGIVLNFVAFKENITQQKEQQERIWQQANYDPLTGLPNRTHFLEQLKHHARLAKRYDRKFALMFIDLDGFKRVNDTLGHDAGDELLRQAAHRLQRQIRSSDTASRLGGDEFTVIMPEFDHCADVDEVASKLVDALATPYTIRGETVTISASIGIAIYPYDGIASDALINHADTAMYAAKRGGKNCYLFFAALNSHGDHAQTGSGHHCA